MPAEIEYQPLEDVLEQVQHETAWEEHRRERAQGQRVDQARRREQKQSRRAGRALAWLFPVLIGLVAANVSGLGPFRIPDRISTVGEAEIALRNAAMFGARRVETYRRQHGALPPDLASLDLEAEAGWGYLSFGATRYQISIVRKDFHAVYDSGAEAVTVSRPGENKGMSS